jgi:hypothetical protein
VCIKEDSPALTDLLPHYHNMETSVCDCDDGWSSSQEGSGLFSPMRAFLIKFLIANVHGDNTSNFDTRDTIAVWDRSNCIPFPLFPVT